MWRFPAAAVVLILAACGAAGLGWTTGGTDADAGGRCGASGADAGRRRASSPRAARPVEPDRDADDAGADDVEHDHNPSGYRPTLVTGRVVDEHGAPIEHAHVAFFLGVRTEDALTDESGAFSRDVTEPTGVVRCLVWATCRALTVLDWRALRQGESTDVGTIRLASAAWQEVRIVGPDGRWESGSVLIDGSGVFGAETWALIARATDLEEVHHLCHYGDSPFLIEGLPPGTYRMTADAFGCVGEPTVVTVPAGDVVVLRVPAEEPEAEPDPAPARPKGTLAISGRVASRGAAVTWGLNGDASETGTKVTLCAKRADRLGACAFVESAEDGSFRFDGLDAAAYDVWANPEPRGDIGLSRASAHVRIDAGADGVVLDLPVALVRRFRLVPDGADPRALPAIEDFDELGVEIEPGSDGLDSARWSSEDGDLIVNGLRPFAAYGLTVRARIGGVWTARAHVRDWTGVADGGAERAGDLRIAVRLPASYRITGRVVREDGSPVVGAFVFTEIPDTIICAEAYAGLDGSFTLAGLEAGAWTLEATAPGLSDAGAEPVVCAGTDGVTLVVRPRRE